MWCACPTRSPHSPSASSCPKDSPLLKVRPSPVEWAPYPHRSHRAPHVRAVFLYPCASAARFSAPSLRLRARSPRRRAENSLILVPNSRLPAPFLRLRAPSSHLRAHIPRPETKTRSFLRRTPAFARQVPPSVGTPSSHLCSHIPRRRAENSLIPAPNSHLHALSPRPSARPRRARRQSPSSARRAPRRHPHLHRTRHKNAPTLPRLGEKT